MSHANGAIIKDGKILGYFEYNGTSDVPISAIWLTYKELHKNWRKNIWNKCKCGEPAEEVILYTDYGSSGFHWRGKVCFRCKAIVSPAEIGGVKIAKGLPPGITPNLFSD